MQITTDHLTCSGLTAKARAALRSPNSDTSLSLQQHPFPIPRHCSLPVIVKREDVLGLGLVIVFSLEVDHLHLVAHLHFHTTIGVGADDLALAPPHGCPVEEDASANQLLGLRTLELKLLCRWRWCHFEAVWHDGLQRHQRIAIFAVVLRVERLLHHLAPVVLLELRVDVIRRSLLIAVHLGHNLIVLHCSRRRSVLK